MPATGDFGPAPPGVDLEENQDVTTISAVATLMVIGTVAVALRLLARMKAKDVGFAADDYLICAGLFFSWGTGIACFIAIPYGNGRHLQALTIEGFTNVWKTLFAYVIIYATAVTFTKASIVMFYRRIFNLRWSLYFCMFLVISYWVVVVVTIFVSCRPLPYFWEQYTNPAAKGVCINIPKFFFGNGVGAMLIDVIILCVPIPIILGLQMPASQKLAVIGILLLGSFVCAASVVRIIMLDRNTKGNDPTYLIAPVFVWSCVEPFIGIVCACLPTFAPFFRRWWTEKVVKSGKFGPYSSGSAPHTSESGRRISKSKPRSKREWARTDYDNLGDEMELTHDISGPELGRRQDSSGDSMSGLKSITVREEVDVSWSHVPRR